MNNAEHLRPLVTMSSAELQRTYEAMQAVNPANLPYRDRPHLTGWNSVAAQFEAEGRAAFPHGRNPYNAGTLANERWAMGWHQADNAAIAADAYLRGEWDNPELMAVGPLPSNSREASRAILEHYLMASHARRVALRRYRDARAIHIGTLKRWKAALRSTDGNPRLVVRVDLGETEVKREAVETGVMMAREALAKLRHDRGAEA